MAKIEEIEMERYRKQIHAELRALAEKYRSIFAWDVPDIDQNGTDRMILLEMRKALDEVEKSLLA
jgi:hypothetical protein